MDVFRTLFRLAAAGVALATLTLTASAQTEFYVDPVNGLDTNTGEVAEPFQTLTHAHTVVAAGDTIWLNDGAYAAAGFGGFETFPLVLQDGVAVRAVVAATPVFDANGGDCFGVQTMTAPSTLEGVTVTNSASALGNIAGASVLGLTVSNCIFTNFSSAGVLLTVENGGATQALTIENCSFSGNGAQRAISVKVSNGTTLFSGAIRGNDVTGGVVDAIVVTARDTAVVDSAFVVENNTVTGFTTAGILMQAVGLGGVSTNTAQMHAGVHGNTLTGDGLGLSVQSGIVLFTDIGASGEGAALDSAVEFNDVAGCAAAISVQSGNDGASLSDITSSILGNHLRDSDLGVEILTQAPNLANVNAAPDFGSATAGGANTLSGNTADLWSTNTTGQISTLNNFFPAGTALIGQGNWNVSRLSETLGGTFASDATANVASTVTLNADAMTRFVDDGNPAGPMQITILLDGTPMLQASIAASALGDALTLLIPALVPATYTMVITNPAGQTGTFSLKAIGGSGSPGNAGGGGCFVATAAHGDYDSSEVYELRRLRDQYLQTTPAGRSFISWYYAEGPTAAGWIAERDWARRSARVALAAPVAVSQALTNWNPGQRFGFGVLLLGLLMAVTRRRVS